MMKASLSLLMLPLALAVLWAAPAQAYTCDDQLQDCLVWAWEDPEERVRELREQECHAQYNECVNQSTVCGDGYCGMGEDCSNCSVDCGTGNYTYDNGVTSTCSYTMARQWVTSGTQYGSYCEYPMYEDGYRTCQNYRKYTVYACNAAPTTTTVYEGTSTHYVPPFFVGMVWEVGDCIH